MVISHTTNRRLVHDSYPEMTHILYSYFCAVYFAITDYLGRSVVLAEVGPVVKKRPAPASVEHTAQITPSLAQQHIIDESLIAVQAM